MKKYAEKFYSSVEWQRCRDLYKQSVGGLCEDCLEHGVFTLAEIVHHVKPITKQNIHDPSITLNPANLRALCRECHAKAHGARDRRYNIDEMGRVSAKPGR